MQIFNIPAFLAILKSSKIFWNLVKTFMHLKKSQDDLWRFLSFFCLDLFDIKRQYILSHIAPKFFKTFHANKIQKSIWNQILFSSTLWLRKECLAATLSEKKYDLRVRDLLGWVGLRGNQKRHWILHEPESLYYFDRWKDFFQAKLHCAWWNPRDQQLRLLSITRSGDVRIIDPSQRKTLQKWQHFIINPSFSETFWPLHRFELEHVQLNKEW